MSGKTQYVDVKFDHLNINNGLSQNSVYCMLQDNQGFLWLGTQDGLNRYDGYEFLVYYKDLEDENSLTDNYITALFQDNNGDLWVGTRNGLNQMNLVTGNISRFVHNNEDSTSLSHDLVYSINQDSKGQLWIGTQEGLNLFHPETNTFDNFLLDTNDLSSIPNNYIRDVYIDEHDILWLASKKGIIKYDHEHKLFRSFNRKNGDPTSLSGDTVTEIIKDKKGMFWVGTTAGLNKFYPDTEKFKQYKSITSDNRSLVSNLVKDIIVDDKGTVWIANLYGLNKYIPATDDFDLYQNSASESQSISRNSLLSLYQDRSGVLWIGTRGGGVDRYHPSQDQFQHFKIQSKELSHLSSNDVWCFVEDEYKNLWFGTSDGLFVTDSSYSRIKSFKREKDRATGILGKIVYDLHIDKNGYLWIAGTGRGLTRLHQNELRKVWADGPLHFEHYRKNRENPEDPYSFPGYSVTRIYEDVKNDVFWLATYERGVIKMNITKKLGAPKFKLFSHDSNDSTSISHNWAKALEMDEKGRLWVGTEVGLNRFDDVNEAFIRYMPDENDANSILEQSIGCIHADKNGIIWVATLGGGLSKFDHSNKRIKHYTANNGLPNNTLYSILEDDNGHFWISSNNGLTWFDPETEEIRNFDFHHGLQSNEFNSNSFYKSNSGKLYFGGVNGFNSFYPDSIVKNQHLPQVSLTQLFVSNKPVQIGKTNKELNISEDDDVILKRSLMSIDTLNLSFHHRVFSIEFSALHFQVPSKNKYAYRLEGFDEEWVYSFDQNHRATYTNLDPGEYTFHVKGANSDGVWNNQVTSLLIVITPPFWRTGWFYALYVIVFISIVLSIYRVRRRRARLKAEKQRAEDRKEYFKTQNEEKTVMLKEIHHRVKNNLQIVNSLLRLQSSEIEDKKIVSMFEEAQKRVVSMALLHEKMYRSEDLKHIDAHEHFDLLATDLISTYSVGKNIELDLDIGEVEIGMKTLVPLGLIINEIITNSLKYAFQTKENGVIKLHINEVEDKGLELLIGDNGSGMDKDLKIEDSASLGGQLVQIFTDQLGGKMERLDVPGTHFRIIFKKLELVE